MTCPSSCPEASAAVCHALAAAAADNLFVFRKYKLVQESAAAIALCHACAAVSAGERPCSRKLVLVHASAAVAAGGREQADLLRIEKSIVFFDAPYRT